MICQNCRKKDEVIRKQNKEISDLQGKMQGKIVEYIKLSTKLNQAFIDLQKDNISLEKKNAENERLLKYTKEFRTLLNKKNQQIVDLQKSELNLFGEKQKMQQEINDLKRQLGDMNKQEEERNKNTSLNKKLQKEDSKSVSVDSSFSNDINNINNEINFGQNVDNLVDNLYSNGAKETIAKINPKDFRELQQKVVGVSNELEAINKVISSIYEKHYNEIRGFKGTWNIKTLNKIEKMMPGWQKMLDTNKKSLEQINYLSLKLIPDRTQQNIYYNQIAKDNNLLKGKILNIKNKKIKNQLIEDIRNIDMNYINFI